MEKPVEAIIMEKTDSYRTQKWQKVVEIVVPGSAWADGQTRCIKCIRSSTPEKDIEAVLSGISTMSGGLTRPVLVKSPDELHKWEILPAVQAWTPETHFIPGSNDLPECAICTRFFGVIDWKGFNRNYEFFANFDDAETAFEWEWEYNFPHTHEKQLHYKSSGRDLDLWLFYIDYDEEELFAEQERQEYYLAEKDSDFSFKLQAYETVVGVYEYSLLCSLDSKTDAEEKNSEERN